MAGPEPARPPRPDAPKKLPRLPPGAKVHKRPLSARQRPASSRRPVVYVSSSTPFMSAVRRVEKLLDRSLRNATAAAPRNASLHARVKALRRHADCSDSTAAATADDDDDAQDAVGATRVAVLGTGRAVEKTLGLAAWFEQRGDCVVGIKTGSVGAIDDIIVDDGEGGVDEESRVRMTSCLEVVVSLR